MRQMAAIVLATLGLVALCNCSGPAGGTGATTRESRQVLSRHQTISVFDGLRYYQCRGLTARCPDDCGHSGDYARFTVKRYLKYEKFGESGEPETETMAFEVQDNKGRAIAPPDILETVRSLRAGDYVRLDWDHEYVTNGGVSTPDRRVLQLLKITPAQAEQLTH